MADSLGMATRLKMSSHPAGAAPDEQVQEKGPSSAPSAGPSNSPAALAQGPVLHVTQVQPTTSAYVLLSRECCPWQSLPDTPDHELLCGAIAAF